MKISTFYSFKGGVGRTSLLANVAACLAERRRVLIWDLDLEAPGVQLIPGLRPPAPRQEGFLEWMAAWQAGRATLSDLGKLVYRAQERLHILPAHGADGVAAYAGIDWYRLFVDEPERGVALFGDIVQHLEDTLSPDHLLIDSRTGLTDLGGLLTALLPHVTVLVGGYSHQNVHGLARIRRSLERAHEHPLRQHPERLELVQVVSPVPPSRSDRAKLRRAAWSREFAAHPIEVPWHGELLYEERLLVVEQPDHPTSLAYRHVAGRLDAGVKVDEPRDVVDASALLHLLFDVESQDDDGTFTVRSRDPVRPRVYRIAVVEDATRQIVEEHARRGIDVLVAARTSDVHPGHDVLTLAGLEASLWTSTPWLEQLRGAFESSALARTYVEPTLGDRSMVEVLVAWAHGDDARVLWLSAPAGAGKTALVRAFTYALAVPSEGTRAAPIPLVADARDLVRDPFVSITDAVPGLRIPVLRYLLDRGRVVLVVDGVEDVYDPEAFVRMLLAAVGERGRVLLVGRPRPTLRELADAHYELPPLDEPQLHELARRSGDAQLADLVQRLDLGAAASPLMLELLAQAPERARQSDRLVDVYATWIDEWVEEHTPAWPRLSAVLFDLGEQERATAATLTETQPAALDDVLRRAPFLHRHQDGAYTFVHRTVRSFVVAMAVLVGHARTYPLDPDVLDVVHEVASFEERARLVEDLHAAALLYPSLEETLREQATLLEVAAPERLR